MTAKNDINDAIITYIVDSFGLERTEVLDENVNLVKDQLIDSLGILKLIMFLEETYRIKLGHNEVRITDFESINSIAALVKNRI